MTDWIITLPKTVRWEDYQKELDDVVDGKMVMNYRLPFRPKARAGDRCFLTWNGIIRGWMAIVGVVSWPNGFVSETNGESWPPGYYMQRSGPFHALEKSVRYPGFRGIRRYEEGMGVQV